MYTTMNSAPRAYLVKATPTGVRNSKHPLLNTNVEPQAIITAIKYGNQAFVLFMGCLRLETCPCGYLANASHAPHPPHRCGPPVLVSNIVHVTNDTHNIMITDRKFKPKSTPHAKP